MVPELKEWLPAPPSQQSLLGPLIQASIYQDESLISLHQAPNMFFILIRIPALLRLIWASPNSMLGLVCGLLGLLTGGGMQLRRGCLEFYGGLVSWALARTPISAAAMTLGHTILGRDPLALECSREHEHVHVRQYARWGPLFLPAYLGASFFLWLNGRHPYWDNPFEREAYNTQPLNRRSDG